MKKGGGGKDLSHRARESSSAGANSFQWYREEDRLVEYATKQPKGLSVTSICHKATDGLGGQEGANEVKGWEGE